MEKALFKEEQQFRQWWYILLVVAATVPSLIYAVYALFQKIVNDQLVGDNPSPTVVLLIMIVFLSALLWSLMVAKLEVMIDQKGIHFRFFPLIRKTRLISREEIQRYEIRQYKPIIDYGGWGIKKRFKWGRAYNVSGNQGLQLYLKNGRKVLFGTQRSQAMIYAMNEMMKSNKRVNN